MFHYLSLPVAGLSFLTPVIGFYCQKCEEFIGDLNSAENHADVHRHSGSSSVSIIPVFPCVGIFIFLSETSSMKIPTPTVTNKYCVYPKPAIASSTVALLSKTIKNTSVSHTIALGDIMNTHTVVYFNTVPHMLSC